MWREPNPHAERLEKIKQNSLSLDAKAGDLVRLNTEMVVPVYREKKKKNEPYEYMIERFTSPAGATNELIVLSCSGADRHREEIAEVIVRGYQNPHPCYVYPCPLNKGEQS